MSTTTTGFVDVQWIKLDDRAIEPFQAYPGDAGFDLHVLDDTWIEVGTRALIPSGIAIALPMGYYARIVGRSSAMAQKGLLVIEGICDSGYRGEQMSGVFNVGLKGDVQLREGDSVAQVIISRAEPANWRLVDKLPGSARGESGYGSSGR